MCADFYRRKPQPPVSVEQFFPERKPWPDMVFGWTYVDGVPVRDDDRPTWFMLHDQPVHEGDWVVRDPLFGNRAISDARFREEYDSADTGETLSLDEFCERFARENPPASVPPEDRLPRRALAACANYARWAREVDRLTAEIKTVVCPEAYPSEWDNLTGGQMDSGAPACFAEARNVMVPTGPWPDDGDRPRRLDEVAAAVADCPECSRLCALIAERRQARQKLGAAKRAVRWAGRAALDRDADRDVDPAPAWPGDLL